MSRGDVVRILVDAGGETAREFEMVANANGRRIEVRQGRGEERSFVMVDLVTRTGTVKLTWRFMATRVIALVEERQEEPDEDEAPVASAPLFVPGQGELLSAALSVLDKVPASFVDVREDSDHGTDDEPIVLGDDEPF